VVIGRTRRIIPEEYALGYILGYTWSNDVSARTFTTSHKPMGLCQGTRRHCPIGPVLATEDAIEGPRKLNIEAIYNGQTVQDGNTADIILDIKKQISYLSQNTRWRLELLS